MITLRPAKFSDVESIHKLLNSYAKEGLMLPRSRNSIYENLRDYVIAVENNRILGCGALHFVWDKLAEIRSMAVDPNLKKTGIGRMIVQQLEKEGIERGVTMFFTLTYQPGFFSKCDYIETSKEKLPQKVWKECVHCSQYPYCNEIAFIKTTVDYRPSDITGFNNNSFKSELVFKE